MKSPNNLFRISLWVLSFSFFFVASAQERHSTDTIFKNLITSGDTKKESDWLSALEDYLKAEKSVLSSKNKKHLITVYEKLALLYYDFDDQKDKLLLYSIEGLELSQQERDTTRTIFFNRCAGVVYTRIDSFSLAKRHLTQALSLNEKTDDYFIQSAIYVDLANMYSLMGQYDKAIDLYNILEKKTISDKLRYINDENERGYNKALTIYHYNWAKVAYQKEDYEECFRLISKSLQEARSYNLGPFYVGIAQGILSMYYNKRKEWNKSVRYGDSAISSLKKINREEFLDSGFQQRYNESLILLGRYKKALINSEYFAKRDDSVSKEKLKNRILHIKKTNSIRKDIAALEDQKYQATLSAEKVKNRNILYLLLLSITAFVIVIYHNRLKKNKLARKLLELRKEKMEDNLSKNKREMISKLMQMSETQTTLISLSKDIDKIRSDDSLTNDLREQLSKIYSKIKMSRNKNTWIEFEKKFEDTNPRFYKLLHEKHPNLSKSERVLCAYLKLNLSTKEIASITGNTIKTVEVNRSRLRKKLGITNNRTINLNIYIRNL